jgi:PAS domain S-box-containing protein
VVDSRTGGAPALHDTVDRDLLAQVVQVSADAIWTEDRTGVVTSWNAAAERLYGRPAGQMVGASAEVLQPARCAEQLRAARDRALAGERVERFDSLHRRVDGSLVPVSLTVSPLRSADGAVSGVATSVQDVTERTRLLADLEHTRRELEGKQQVLLRSNRDLEQFAYVASHDLSEPLRVITGYVQLLERRYADAFDERGERYVRHVVEGCQRMRDLIDDLLHYSRFLRVEREPLVVDTGAVVRAVVTSLQAQVDAAGATVVVGDLLPVHSDPTTLTALVQNLVSNAVKFHRPGRSPRVEVSTVPEAGSVVLRVDDDGIGIAPAFREKVFRMFQRLHVREEYGGTGIGLAVVQKVAEQAGGRVWIEDSPLGGARFCVTLPRAGATRADPAAAGPPAHAPQEGDQ